MANTTPNPQGSELSSELQRLRNSQSPLEDSAKRLAYTPKDPAVWELRRSLVVDLKIPLEKEIDFVGEFSKQDSRNHLMWRYRRWIVEKLGSEAASKDLKIGLEKELDFIGEFAERDSRNHLIWQHRHWIVEKLGYEAASKELESTKRILSKDAKIYQAWSHRAWIIKEFGGSWWLAELQYCHDVLEKDIFNIFAWDQICRVVRSIPNMEKELRDKEVIYAKKAIQAHPGNESAWTYLKCLYMKHQSSLYKESDLESVYVDFLDKEASRVEAAVRPEGSNNVMDGIVDKRGCLHALNLILDLVFLGYEGSAKLLRAVKILRRHCDRSSPYAYDHWDPRTPKIFKHVCLLALCLDPERISFCNTYRGYSRFQYLSALYQFNNGINCD